MPALRLFLLPAFLLLAACTISLLPDYDEALHDGLNSANKNALTLFSALSGGSPAAQFPKHAASYHAVIGEFGALLTRAETRPEPVLGQRFAARMGRTPGLRNTCAAVEEGKSCVIVTPLAIREIIETLSKLRDRHKASGLKPGIVALNKLSYETAIEQALTVESALKP